MDKVFTPLGRLMRYAVAGSGGGSTIKRLWKETQEGGALYGRVEIPVIITDNPKAGLITGLPEIGCPAELIRVCAGQDRDLQIIEALNGAEADCLGLHGYNRWISAAVAKAVREVFNQHPANPKYCGGEFFHGLVPHIAALEIAKATGRWETELVFQFASLEGWDEGQIIASSIVPLFQNETPEMAQDRLIKYEHDLCVAGVSLVAECMIGGYAIPTIKSRYVLHKEERLIAVEARRTALASVGH